MDVEAWWRSGDGGFDQVVKVFSIDDFSQARYESWLSKAVRFGGAEIRPLDWWQGGFWRGF